jgi:hypothetical protein
MVRQRFSHWSSNRGPEDAAFALLAIGLVPETLRTASASQQDVLAALREVLCTQGRPVRWRLNAAHGRSEGWESVVAVDDLAAAVREALPCAEAVEIECGDALDPEDVLEFFTSEPESAALRAAGWTFAMAPTGSEPENKP